MIFLSPFRKCRVSSGELPGVGHGRLVPNPFQFFSLYHFDTTQPNIRRKINQEKDTVQRVLYEMLYDDHRLYSFVNVQVRVVHYFISAYYTQQQNSKQCARIDVRTVHALCYVYYRNTRKF